MSTQGSPSSPRLVPSAQIDESNLPQGQCRYILLLPEIKGQRCACVNFTLNRAMPSATCDCGHLACFHIKEAEQPLNRKELDLLKQRLVLLEEQLTKEQEGGQGTLVTRVGEVEERLDKSREEFGEQIKGAYRNITRSWNSITELERRDGRIEESLRQMDVHLQEVDAELHRLDDRQMELVDADISLEERIENLVDTIEEQGNPNESHNRRPRRRSTSDANRPSHLLGSANRPPGSRSLVQRPRSLIDSTGTLSPTGESASTPSFRPSVTSAPAPDTWTVHISLLPNASLPFPFERNTNAYQRCLSRGMHRTVAIRGTSSESFVAAVSQTFENLLKGRPWMPLQAKLCDAKQLRGLPMLRPLDPTLVDCDYDAEFLQRHCAVCDPSGNIDSLYIAMRADTLSWHALKLAPAWMEGLEASWTYDPLLLDASDPFDDDYDDDDADRPVARPAAGDIVSTFNPSLKRAASEISRSASFGAATAAAGPVVDMNEDGSSRVNKRSCPPQTAAAAIVEVRRRGVETV